MNLFKEVKNYNGKNYTQLVVQFDNGFTLPVKPCFDLSKPQYRAYMLNIEKLPLYEISVKDINDACNGQMTIDDFLKEGDK